MTLIFPPPKLFTTSIEIIKVPINGISEEGQRYIRDYLNSRGYPQLPENWDWEWKVARGPYAGTFPKRVARFFYKECQRKVGSDFISALGTLASQYVFKQEEFFVDFTNDFSWSPGDFGEPTDSCFWGCRQWAKNMIYDNGGKSIRFYRDKYGQGMARAWIVPAPKKYENCELVFNAYSIDLLLVARIYAHFKNQIYSQVCLLNNGSGEKMLWINLAKGYLIGPPQVITKLSTDISIDLKFDEWRLCRYCRHTFSERDLIPLREESEGDFVCKQCIEYYERCKYCHNLHLKNDIIIIENKKMCIYCAQELGYTQCGICRQWHHKNVLQERYDIRDIRTQCYDRLYLICPKCLGELQHKFLTQEQVEEYRTQDFTHEEECSDILYLDRNRSFRNIIHGLPSN